MAVFSGNKGMVYAGASQVANVTNWSLTVEADNLDSSAMGTEWRTFITGIKQWSGTIDAHWDLTDTAQKALFDALTGSTLVSLKLYVDSTRNFSGAAMITSADTTVPFDGIETITFNFQGNGALTRSV